MKIYFCATGNKFFLKATGLKPEEIECMTIFSLVKPDKLSNLFEIVATALRGEGEQNNDATMTNGETSGQTDGEPTSSADDATPPSRQWNYAAMTLPCVTFPATKLRRQTASESKSSELFMTVRSNCVYGAWLQLLPRLTHYGLSLAPGHTHG
jgi:hypothetical protein